MPLSFDEYRNIWWRSEIGAGQPAKYDTYKKFKQLSASDCETAIKQLIYEKPDESETTLTPKNKCSWESYVSPHCHQTEQNLFTLCIQERKREGGH